MSETDGELVQRLRKDDLTALGVLFERYRDQIYRTAYAITHDAAAAEDILQDVLLKAYSFAQRLNDSVPLAPWLYRVTVNLSYSWITRHRQRWISLEAVVEKLVSPLRSTPERVAESNEIHSQLRSAIEALPFNQRVVVVLHYLNDQDVAQIAEILDLPIGTIKSRLYYAREGLRQQLGSLDWEGEPLFGF
ncbi:MAG: RNA polymerase sigma factor [Aggregatilineales bacterium]